DQGEDQPGELRRLAVEEAVSGEVDDAGAGHGRAGGGLPSALEVERRQRPQWSGAGGDPGDPLGLPPCPGEALESLETGGPDVPGRALQVRIQCSPAPGTRGN